MKAETLDVCIIAAYFIGIVSLGLWISRRQAKGGKEFFLAGQQMKWPFIGASLFATNISSQQFVGQAGLAFTVGIIAGGFQMIGAMCFMFLALFFLQTYMGLKLTTSPEFFERDEYEDFSLLRVLFGYGLPTLAAVGIATISFYRRDL